MVLSSHKMLGPTGIGALVATEELLAAMPPVLTGGSMIEIVTMESSTFMSGPPRFEAGSQPLAQAAGWRTAVEYLARIGLDRLHATEQALTRQVLEGLDQAPGLRLVGPSDTTDRLGVVAFSIDESTPTTSARSSTPPASPCAPVTTAPSLSTSTSASTPPRACPSGPAPRPRKWTASCPPSLTSDATSRGEYERTRPALPASHPRPLPRAPRFRRPSTPPDATSHQVNPTCGDDVTLGVRVKDVSDGGQEAVHFLGRGAGPEGQARGGVDAEVLVDRLGAVVAGRTATPAASRT